MRLNGQRGSTKGLIFTENRSLRHSHIYVSEIDAQAAKEWSFKASYRAAAVEFWSNLAYFGERMTKKVVLRL